MVACFFGAFFLLEKPPLTDASIQTSSVEDYDIILIAGRSFRSRVIRLFGCGTGEWSHVGILRKEDGKIFILHATPDSQDGNAIQYEPLGALFERKAVAGIRVVRLAGLNLPQWDAVRLRFEKVKSETRPFNYTFDMQNQSNIYCSELVLMVFSGLLRDVDTSRAVHPGMFGAIANSVVVF